MRSVETASLLQQMVYTEYLFWTEIKWLAVSDGECVKRQFCTIVIFHLEMCGCLEVFGNNVLPDRLDNMCC